MNDPTVKNQAWVKNFSIDLHKGEPDFIMLTCHRNNGKRHRVAIPVPLVAEITEAMKGLVT